MMSTALPSDQQRSSYNAELTYVRRVHDDLLICRVRPDEGPLAFEAGQYTVLGLGYWEPRIAGVQTERLSEDKQRRLAKRAYSISCRLVDSRGRLASQVADDELEFYITLVRRAVKPPALTPRLFRRDVGSRIFIGSHAHGRYTLRGVGPDDQVVFAATGTGEAPHNAMVACLLGRGHRGRIVSVTCVRHRRDLGYLEQHRALQQQFPQYCYIPLTTREPENLDPKRPDFVGKRYLQDFFEAEDFTKLTGCVLTPQNTHVFLCGGPQMIGAPRRSYDPKHRLPKPRGAHPRAPPP